MTAVSGVSYEKFKTLALILKASRITKILPLLFLMINGALVSGAIISLSSLFLPAAVVMVVILLGMQLNVITDVDLDKKLKPQLIRWLTRDPQLLRRVMSVEILIVFTLLLAILNLQGISLFLSLSMVSVLSILYSYNFFFVKDPARYRLKIYWWGHLGTIWLSYFGLWFSGYLLGHHFEGCDITIWITFFLFLSLMDYALFLCESAGDAIEEKEFGYQTFPALLGSIKTHWLALTIWTVSLFAWLGTLQYLPAQRRFNIILAFLPYVVVQSSACIGMIYLSSCERNLPRLSRIMDGSFWLSRLMTTLILLR